jgi:alkyl hydroperoxide reductase subunit AhpF
VYDLIVIGDDLASHVAAAYASQNGLKTLLIAESGLGGLQLIGDFIFNLDATPLTGLGPDQFGPFHFV